MQHIHSSQQIDSSKKIEQIPLVECRPRFEDALARIAQKNDGSVADINNAKSGIEQDSFGSWREWD